jgi:hypothetical protein
MGRAIPSIAIAVVIVVLAGALYMLGTNITGQLAGQNVSAKNQTYTFSNQSVLEPWEGQAATETPGPVVVYVNPEKADAALNSSFKIELNIDANGSVYGVEMHLLFNDSVLEVLSIGEGSFLKSDGAKTYPIISKNESGVFFSDTRFGTPSGVSGSGSLATVEFRSKSRGETALVISEAMVLDEGLHKLNFSSEGGYVKIV